MTIYDLLKAENARISLGFRWLIIDEDNAIVVYERKPYQKLSRVLYYGDDESIACEILVGE